MQIFGTSCFCLATNKERHSICKRPRKKVTESGRGGERETERQRQTHRHTDRQTEDIVHGSGGVGVFTAKEVNNSASRGTEAARATPMSNTASHQCLKPISRLATTMPNQAVSSTNC